MPNYCHECGTATSSHTHVEVSTPVVKKIKATRKPSAYNKAYAKQYAKLKKKHPRTSFAGLAKKAHAATKKVMK